jgi:hypothetical protein
MSDQDKTQTSESTPNALTAAEQKKRELVNFVANNILNGLTMNQTIQVIQQVALRDANTIVSEADEEKLKEIETAYENARAQAEAARQESQSKEAGASAPAKKTAAKKTSKARKSTKKAAA